MDQETYNKVRDGIMQAFRAIVELPSEVRYDPRVTDLQSVPFKKATCAEVLEWTAIYLGNAREALMGYADAHGLER